MKYERSWVAAWLAIGTLALASGCGVTVVEYGDDDDSGGGGSAASGATGGSGAAGATGGTGGTGGTFNVCTSFYDEQGLDSVTVRFRNDSGQPIYLPATCDSSVLYNLVPAGGPDEVSYIFDRSCLQTCEGLQTEPPFLCDACAPVSLLLPAGATRDVVWHGTGLTWVDMPGQCWFDADYGDTCGQIVAAPSGMYHIDATGFADCELDCTCDEDGLCWGYPSGEQALSDGVKLSFPGTPLVEVVFGPCAFGCPEG